MEFRLLGPLEVSDDDRPIEIGRGRRRSLLALLLMHPNEVVSAERLIDELWGERPTPTATKSLHVYVSQLRKELQASGDGEVVLTRGNGYVARVGPDDVDVVRFERLLADGRRLLAVGDAARAGERLRKALALWRGPPLADFAYEPFAQGDIARLEEQRLVALEGRIEADLALGRHAELVAELEALVREHPLREGLRGQLMLALYRCGRQAEALEVYRAGRATCVEELGIEPGPALRELEGKILAQSAELAPPAAPRGPVRRRPGEQTAPPARGRRRSRGLVVVIVGGAVLLAAAIGAAVWRDGGRGGAARAPALDLARNSLAAVDPTTGTPTLARQLLGRPTDVAAEGGRLWAVTVDSAALTGVDARAHTIFRDVALRFQPSAVAFGYDWVWVADGRRGEVVRVAPGYDQVSAPIRFAARRPEGRAADATSLAAGAGGVWVTDGSERLARIDPVSRAVTYVPVGVALNGVAVGAGAVWAISGPGRAVVRIEPATGTVRPIELAARAGEEAPFPVAIAATDEAVWVLNRNTATVVRIDPVTEGPAAVIPIGVDRVPNDIAAAGRTAWTANEDGSLSRMEVGAPAARSLWVGESLRSVAVSGSRLWVTTAALDQQLPGGAG
jgi:DNA-binding SARP family transcriptional activator